MLSVIELSVFLTAMQSIVTLNVIMLSVAAPSKGQCR
jgi:hypothetical protein